MATGSELLFLVRKERTTAATTFLSLKLLVQQKQLHHATVIQLLSMLIILELIVNVAQSFINVSFKLPEIKLAHITCCQINVTRLQSLLHLVIFRRREHFDIIQCLAS